MTLRDILHQQLNVLKDIISKQANRIEKQLSMASDSDDLSNIGVFDSTGLELCRTVLEADICYKLEADTIWLSDLKLDEAYPGRFGTMGFCKQPVYVASHSTRVLESPSTPIALNYLQDTMDQWQATLSNARKNRLPPVGARFEMLGHGLRALRSGYKNLDFDTGVEFPIVAGCTYRVTPGHVYVFENPAAVPAQLFEEQWVPIAKQKRVGTKKRTALPISKQSKIARTTRKRRHSSR